MKVKIICLLMALMALTVLIMTACDELPETSGYTPSVSPVVSSPEPKNRILYNGYYGIEITVPGEWYVQYVNEKNLTVSREDSSNIDDMDVFIFESGGCGLEMIEFWNREDSSDSAHASFSMFIEAYEGVTEQEYIDAMAEAFAGDFDGYISTLKESGARQLDGREYGFISYRTEPPEGDTAYIEEYYIEEIDVSTFAVVCVTYWEGSSESYDAAVEALGAFSLS